MKRIESVCPGDELQNRFLADFNPRRVSRVTAVMTKTIPAKQVAKLISQVAQFHRVSPENVGFYHILPYFTIFYHILPYFTIFYHILPANLIIKTNGLTNKRLGSHEKPTTVVLPNHPKTMGFQQHQLGFRHLKHFSF